MTPDTESPVPPAGASGAPGTTAISDDTGEPVPVPAAPLPVRPTLEAAIALYRRRFFNRTDRIAVLAPWGKPCPASGGEGLDALLATHVLGLGAPEAHVTLFHSKGVSAMSGRFRIGTYCPGSDGTTRWLCLDFDGKGHATALADPRGAALATLGAFEKAGLPAYLESSGGGHGWHLWVFFDSPVEASMARALGRALAPGDAPLAGPRGGVADPAAGRGIEVFPKQERIRRGGYGNLVWLPWWRGAPAGASLFYRRLPGGDLEPYVPEDFETAAPEALERALATVVTAAPAQTVRRSSVVGHGGLWPEWRKHALAALPLESVYGSWLTGKVRPGWKECRDPWSTTGDQDPSAGVADGTGEAERGAFHSFISEKTLSVFDFLIERGEAKDFIGAARMVAGLAHVPLPGEGPGPDGAPLAAGEILCTDLGNARRLVALHGADLRYCPSFGWFAWDGRRWKRDDTGAAMRRAKAAVESIWKEAAQAKTLEEQKDLAKWAVESQGAARLEALLRLASTEEAVAVPVSVFDEDPWLLNVRNGTLDLRTGDLRPHRREDLLTKLAPVDYDPAAACPTFERFLEQVFESKRDLIEFVQKALGYALTGDVTRQVLFFLHGEGANGKSTLVETILFLLGEYAAPAAPDLLLARRGERHPTEIADLFGRRFVSCIEVGQGRSFNEALVKWLTGGDRLKARLMRQDFFEFAPTFKVFLCANHKPRVAETNHAFWRRIRLIPFNVIFRERPRGVPPTDEPRPGEQDPGLPAKLRAEAPGILRWTVEGCLRMQREGLRPPEAVERATEDYRQGEDVLGLFLEECCLLSPAAQAGKTLLYEAYVSWARRAGESVAPMREFRKYLIERGFAEGRTGHDRARCWTGIGLLVPPERGPGAPPADTRTDADGKVGMNGGSARSEGVHTESAVRKCPPSAADATDERDTSYDRLDLVDFE